MALKEAFSYLMTQASTLLTQIYSSFTSVVPVKYHIVFNLFIYVFLIAFYGFFVWKFYQFLARKDIVKIDFYKYRWSSHPFLDKLSVVFIFLIEHLIIIPVLVTFWFTILSLFLLVLSKNQSVETIVITAAAIITSTRLLSYYSSELSKEIARLFPLTLLAIFLLEPNFFSLPQFVQRIQQVPSLVDNIMIYLIFIIILELILKSISAFLSLSSIHSDEMPEDTTTVKELIENKQENRKPVIVKKEEVFDYKPSPKVNKDNKYFVVPKQPTPFPKAMPSKKVEKIKKK